MSLEIDFGELANDENFKRKILDLDNSLSDASKVVEDFFSKFTYDELAIEDKVGYDLFVAFAIDTLFWIYLRIKGVDANNHEIKQQINRIREYMAKSKQIYEKKTIMPRIDQGAAKRFIKSGLWTPNSSSSSTMDSPSSSEVPPAKRPKND